MREYRKIEKLEEMIDLKGKKIEFCWPEKEERVIGTVGEIGTKDGDIFVELHNARRIARDSPIKEYPKVYLLKLKERGFKYKEIEIEN